MAHSIQIINQKKSGISIKKARYCDDFFSRLQGFTFRKQLDKDEGLVLVEKHDSRVDTSIHMFFVWTDLAVFWVDSSYTVVDKVLAKSWRPFYASQKPARFVVEIHPDRLSDFEIGDKVKFENA